MGLAVPDLVQGHGEGHDMARCTGHRLRSRAQQGEREDRKRGEAAMSNQARGQRASPTQRIKLTSS